MSANRDYKVGYKRPPKEHQFKKGISGNPKGRPKNNATFAENVLDEMQEKIMVKESGKPKKITKKQALAKKLVAEALNGKNSAIKLLLPILASETNLTKEVDEELSANDAQIIEDYITRRFNNENCIKCNL